MRNSLVLGLLLAGQLFGQAVGGATPGGVTAAENLTSSCTDAEVLGGDGMGGVECQADAGGTPSADSVGTAEIDDASDTPVENYFVAVDAATTGFQYIQIGTGLAVSGSEYARTLAVSLAADSVGTAEIDDASDTPVENYLFAVDAATTGVQYIQVGSGLAVSGSEYARTLAIAATTVDTTSSQTLEAKTLTDPSLGDDSSFSRRVVNDTGSGGTSNNDLAKIQDAGDNSEEAITAGTGDTNKHVYPVRTGGATSGNAELAVLGEVQIDMDGACSVGDNVILSTSVAGEGSCTSSPLAQNVHCVGVATQTTGAAGLADVDLSADCSRVAEGAGETRSFSWAITDPATGDSEALQWLAYRAVTITAINCSTDTGTADIQLDERALTTPNTGGTDVMGSALQCDSDNAQQTSFSNAGIASGALANLDIDAVASAPTQLRIHVTYTVN